VLLLGAVLLAGASSRAMLASARLSCLVLLMRLHICRLFSDDSSDSIQFLADSDEQQNDNAAADSASVCVVTGK